MYKLISIIKSIYIRIIRKCGTPLIYARLIGVKIGNNNFIPDKETWSSEPYLITIGNNNQITMGVRIFTHGGGQAIRNKFPDFDCFGKVVIGDFVYIGNNSLIMPGVTIGDGALIAAGSVVTKSVPSKMVVGGNPAQIICTIDEYINRNEQYNIHTKGLNADEKKQKLLLLSDESFIQKKFMRKKI